MSRPDSDVTESLHDSSNPAATREFIVSRTQDIQKLYSRWDRGLIGTNGFVLGLEDLHIPLSTEFKRLMEVNGSSRNLSFAQLMSSLQINDFVQRKARQRPLDTGAVYTEIEKKLVQNPVTWVQPGNSPVASEKQDDEIQNRMRRVICDFCDDVTDSAVFVSQLEALGVSVTAPLQRLIRNQSGGNGANFREFAAEIMRQGDNNIFGGTNSASRDQEEAEDLAPMTPVLPIAPNPDHPNLPHFFKAESAKSTGRQHVDHDHTSLGQVDIIGWTNHPIEKRELVTTSPRHHGDILAWDRSEEKPGVMPAEKPTRRHFHISNRGDAPFGTDRDIGKPMNTFYASTDCYRQAR